MLANIPVDRPTEMTTPKVYNRERYEFLHDVIYQPFESVRDVSWDSGHKDELPQHLKNVVARWLQVFRVSILWPFFQCGIEKLSTLARESRK
jgi:hypothetical protein